MTIIFDNGSFWIESIIMSIPTDSPAGLYISPVTNLSRPGHYVGHSMSYIAGGGGVARPQALAYLDLARGDSVSFQYGMQVSTVIGEIVKNADAAGPLTTLAIAIIFMRS